MVLKVTQAATRGVDSGSVLLTVISDDDKRYEMALSPSATAQAIVSLIKSASTLPPDSRQSVEVPAVPVGFQLAIGPGMRPAILLSFGGATVAADLSEQQLASLHEDIGRALSGLQKMN